MRNNCRQNRGCDAARGQALIEALIGVAALTLLAALGLMVGKYQMVAQAVVDTSHSLAFECAMMPANCLASTVTDDASRRTRSHHFTDAADGLRQTTAWSTRNGTHFLSGTDDDIQLHLTHPQFDAGLGVLRGGARSAAGSAVHVVSNLAGPGRFDLDITGGLVSAHVQANLFQGQGQSGAGTDHTNANGLNLLAGIAVPISAHSAIIADFWNASGPTGSEPTSVQTRVEKGQRLANWIETAQRVGYAPTLGFIRLMGAISLEDSASEFKYHEIDVDVIPVDRQGPAQ
ncbi:MAG: hypothetical protein WBD51_09705 [Burkholderiaceae bacterium]